MRAGGTAARVTRRAPGGVAGSQSAPTAGPARSSGGPPLVAAVSVGESSWGPGLGEKNPGQKGRQHTRGFGWRPGQARAGRTATACACWGFLQGRTVFRGVRKGGALWALCPQKVVVLCRARRCGCRRGGIPHTNDRCRLPSSSSVLSLPPPPPSSTLVLRSPSAPLLGWARPSERDNATAALCVPPGTRTRASVRPASAWGGPLPASSRRRWSPLRLGCSLPQLPPFFCTLRAIVFVFPTSRRLLVWSCRRPWHVASWWLGFAFPAHAAHRARSPPNGRGSATRVSPRPWCSPRLRPLGAPPPPPHPPPRWPSRAHPAWRRRPRRRLWRRRPVPLAYAWPCHRCPPSRRCLRCSTTRARRPPRRLVVAAPLGATGRP